MNYLGVDLGTTYSMIAHVNAHGQPALFPDVHNASHFRTPSIVHIGREGCLVGAAAEELLDDAPDLPVVRFVKARLGQPATVLVDHQGREWCAEALVALILRKLLNDAETFSNAELGGTVLTVPAQFTDEQRRAMLRAADLAGLQKVTLMEEPVAAATYYGDTADERDRTLLVYDFGGGTFDVTIVQTGRQRLFVLATDGISKLGGRFLDEQIMELVGDDCARRFGRSPLQDAAAEQRLRRLAEETKIKMSRSSVSQAKQSLLLLGESYDFVLTRNQFEALATAAVRHSLEACERCLAAASLAWKDIDSILLTGGSSLLPQVTSEIKHRSGKSGHDIVSRQPHQAVVFGAAILAQQFGRLAGADSNIRQVTGADICLRVWDRSKRAMTLEVLIPRNSALPATYSRAFFTNRDDQTRIVLEFVQRRGDPPEEFSLGIIAFGPIVNPRKNYPLEVTVSLSRDGLVRVTAKDPAMGTEVAQLLQEGAGARSPLEDQRRLIESIAINA